MGSLRWGGKGVTCYRWAILKGSPISKKGSHHRTPCSPTNHTSIHPACVLTYNCPEAPSTRNSIEARRRSSVSKSFQSCTDTCNYHSCSSNILQKLCRVREKPRRIRVTWPPGEGTLEQRQRLRRGGMMLVKQNIWHPYEKQRALCCRGYIFDCVPNTLSLSMMKASEARGCSNPAFSGIEPKPEGRASELLGY